jgi:GNAT superfamily N-acetyltransferase
MWWRVTQTEFTREAGAGLRRRLQGLVADGREPGLLAYRDERPVGWVSVAPRREFGRMERSPKLRQVDDTPVWVINCLFIDRRHRRSGVGRALIDAAIDHARKRGAVAVEAVPIDTAGATRPTADLFTGTLGMFTEAGFTEIERRGGRPIVRRRLSRRGGTGR